VTDSLVNSFFITNEQIDCMEDQHNITDTGWAAMKWLLDQEMPQKRRYRGGWWWSGSALLLLLLWAGWQYTRQAPSTNMPIPTAPTKPVQPVAESGGAAATAMPAAVQENTDIRLPAKANIAVPGSASVHYPHAKSYNNRTLAAIPKNMQAPQPSESTKNYEKLALQNQWGVQNAVPSVPVQTEGVQLTENNTQKSGTQILEPGGQKKDAEQMGQYSNAADQQIARVIPAADLLNASENTATFQSSAPNEMPQTIKAHTALPHLVALTPLNLPEWPPAPVFAETRIKRPSGSSHWKLGIAANVLGRNFLAADGYAAGLTIDWQLGSRAWGLRSGILYAQERWSSSNTVNQQRYVPFPAADYFEKGLSGRYTSGTFSGITPIPNSITADSLAGKDVYLQLSMVRRLELPLNLFWQATPRLRLYGGASFVWMTKALGRTEGAIIPKVLENNKSVYANPDISAVNSLVTASLPRFSTRLQLGIGWRVRPRIELNAGFQLPLAAVTPGSQSIIQAEDNSGLDASGNVVRYQGNNRISTVSNGNFPPLCTLGATFFLRRK